MESMGSRKIFAVMTDMRIMPGISGNCRDGNRNFPVKFRRNFRRLQRKKCAGF